MVYAYKYYVNSCAEDGYEKDPLISVRSATPSALSARTRVGRGARPGHMDGHRARREAGALTLGTQAVNVTDQKCMDYARECVRLAQSADNNPEVREHLLHMAREWMAVTMHEETPPELMAPGDAASPADRQMPHDYESYRLCGSYRTLEAAIATLEDLYATGEVQPSEQPRIEYCPGELFSYVIVIGRKAKSAAEVV